MNVIKCPPLSGRSVAENWVQISPLCQVCVCVVLMWLLLGGFRQIEENTCNLSGSNCSQDIIQKHVNTISPGTRAAVVHKERLSQILNGLFYKSKLWLHIRTNCCLLWHLYLTNTPILSFMSRLLSDFAFVFICLPDICDMRRWFGWDEHKGGCVCFYTNLEWVGGRLLSAQYPGEDTMIQ